MRAGMRCVPCTRPCTCTCCTSTTFSPLSRTREHFYYIPPQGRKARGARDFFRGDFDEWTESFRGQLYREKSRQREREENSSLYPGQLRRAFWLTKLWPALPYCSRGGGGAAAGGGSMIRRGERKEWLSIGAGVSSEGCAAALDAALLGLVIWPRYTTLLENIFLSARKIIGFFFHFFIKIFFYF